MAPEKRKFENGDATTPKKQKSGYSAGAKWSGAKGGKHQAAKNDFDTPIIKDGKLNGLSSREAHVKQKALAQQRKGARPNADSIARSKKIWERIRRKSHVEKEERDKLVKELFEIITGRVQEFVFKHDSVRVIQCALKYATPAQRVQIAQELRGSYRELAESRYAKFLIAKMVVGDKEVADMVTMEFFGHVKRLIRHPEASWILDDIYRGLATPSQKAIMLREWYGPEFVLFQKDLHSKKQEKVSADLSEILKESPEKRGPIMQHLKEMTNLLVQKKTTGYTMLHDALLQYFVNCKPGSAEATEFLEMLRDDEEGDCYKNLAFTKSGSKLVCLALAYGSAKDRRTILKFFKTHMKLLAADVNGCLVLLSAFEVIDDTVASAKAIFPELLGKELEADQRETDLLAQAISPTARISLLYLMSSTPPKWLLTAGEKAIIDEIKEIRTTTSKKEPETRRLELVKAISQPLIDLISTQAATLVQSSYGCQFITEVLLGGLGEKQAAMDAIADLAISEEASEEVLGSAHIGRMLKTLVQGGRYDQTTKSIIPTEPPLLFNELFYNKVLGGDVKVILKWANSPNSFVIVSLAEDNTFTSQAQLKTMLKEHSSDLQAGNRGAELLKELVVGLPVRQLEKKVRKAK